MDDGLRRHPPFHRMEGFFLFKNFYRKKIVAVWGLFFLKKSVIKNSAHISCQFYVQVLRLCSAGQYISLFWQKDTPMKKVTNK